MAIIPARGGSKGVPRKNIAMLAGKPLIWYTITAALECPSLGEVMVSTEDEEIGRVSKECGAVVIHRPEALAADDTPTLPVLQHAVTTLEHARGSAFDTVVVLQPTSPLRIAEDIDGAIHKMLATGCDSVVSVCELEHPLEWVLLLDGDRVIPPVEARIRAGRRQEARKAYRPNGAVYVARRDIIIRENRILGEDTRAYVMPPERSVDIDTELDLRVAEAILQGRGSREQ